MSDAEQARFAAMLGSDWTACVDDGIRGWPDHCTLCRAAPGTWWSIFVGRPVAVTSSLCDRCHRDSTHEAKLETLFQARYGQLVTVDRPQGGGP